MHPNHPPQRIVSLLPATTEMVFALGAGDRLVARSHECDYPPEATRLPAVTAARLDPSQSSAAIQQAVRTALSNRQPLFRLDADRLRSLQPDLILTQAQCDVCAISPAELDDLVQHLPDPRPSVLALAPQRFADLWTDLRRVAVALGIPDEGRSVISALKSRVVDVIQRVSAASERPTMACLEWLDPLMGAGNWIPELVELAGAEPVLAQAGTHSAWIQFEQLAAANPHLLVALPCGFDLERTRQELASWATRFGAVLPAVREGRVFAADGNAFFNRPGPRLVDSLEMLAEIAHPALHPEKPVHRGTGWVPL